MDGHLLRKGSAAQMIIITGFSEIQNEILMNADGFNGIVVTGWVGEFQK
jgi:hypothetical protein